MRNKFCDKKTKFNVVSHFKTRCIERIGIILGQNELKDELFVHKNGKSKYHQSNTKTHFVLSEKFLKERGISTDKEVAVIYDKLRHAFVTVITFKKRQNGC